MDKGGDPQLGAGFQCPVTASLTTPEGKEIELAHGIGRDPSYPEAILYRYALGDQKQAEAALDTAFQAHLQYRDSSFEERSALLVNVAQKLRQRRGALIGAMIADTGKTIFEGDVEVSEAIDMAEYYSLNLLLWASLGDLEWHSKGVVLVAPPWNFPCSIPAGGILAALAGGNSVIFKPAPEAVLVGWTLVQAFWEAGVSPEVLQFFNCLDEPTVTWLVQNPRISTVILTGATATAKYFLKLRPGLDLIGETGGKNALIITAMADRDLAIKNLVQSAFGHSGQKCSACSIAICEAEVYDDPHFMQQLADAAASLKVGVAWDFSTCINPLINSPNSILQRALTKLEPGEKWLLQPKPHPANSHLWSPGIKLGVAEGSFTHQTELFGPVLGLMRAYNLPHAVKLANSTPYGLTSGIHTLDEREQHYWIKHIKTGNGYINRGITGAIVQRQPFGGCKESSFGPGAKAGGPNYLIQLMRAKQRSLPEELALPNKNVALLNAQVSRLNWNAAQHALWECSLGNYAFCWQHYFSQDQAPSEVLGQFNILRYVPREKMVLRLQNSDAEIDVLRSIAAALTCGAHLEVSVESSLSLRLALRQILGNVPHIHQVEESEEKFLRRLALHKVKRVRLLSPASQALEFSLGQKGCSVLSSEVLANGRVELLHYLREFSLSIDYHRYGNLLPTCGSL